MCCKLHESNTRPLGDHFGGVQSSKTLGNYHWLLAYPSAGFSFASSCALNSPNECNKYVRWVVEIQQLTIIGPTLPPIQAHHSVAQPCTNQYVQYYKI